MFAMGTMSMPSADGSAPDVAISGLSQTIARGLEIVAVRTLGNADEARDAVQETLARALAAIRSDRIPPGVALEAFVYGIARHVITDVQRGRARERGAVEDPGTLPAPGPSALEALVHAEERETVARALAAIPTADRVLLELCFVDGERVSAIAAHLGEPADRVRKRKSRALERMREVLDRWSGGHETPQVPILPT
jgi:RNA polymerase sigma-70 factor (ECF subfamily)